MVLLEWYPPLGGALVDFYPGIPPYHPFGVVLVVCF